MLVIGVLHQKYGKLYSLLKNSRTLAPELVISWLDLFVSLKNSEYMDCTCYVLYYAFLRCSLCFVLCSSTRLVTDFNYCKLSCRNKGILFVAIDHNRPLSEQGPFDIVLQKVIIFPALNFLFHFSFLEEKTTQKKLNVLCSLFIVLHHVF